MYESIGIKINQSGAVRVERITAPHPTTVNTNDPGRHHRHTVTRTGEEEVDAREVVGEGIEPHVEDVAGLEARGDGDAPVEGRPRDGEVHQVLLQPRWFICF